ncbi:MAG: DUF2142 domain-containing protein [Anaerolineales bacterium]|nr:DUF2142 domain-containing protein [Anaerolineales bacterium]MCB9127294.1 DUF2142 domain-containing protein [Ardenticatenales bacterium]MCB9172583.1 DUF2142 domain-containing protein [Ardenticatenales bacterium]
MNRRDRAWLVALWGATFLLAALFAWRTPAWQAPDEPAHYAYVATVAEQGHAPRLVAACYNEGYKNALVSGNFQAEIDFDRFCYEGHQPPLFYALAAPLFAATKGSLLALRLFSALIGALVPVVAWLIVRALGGDRPLATATAVWVALVPQHLAMIGALNNDGLTFLLVALAVWRMLRYLAAPSRRNLLLMALLVALCLITKTLAWVALPLALLTALLAERGRAMSESLASATRAATVIVAVAALFVLPWMARNSMTYGGFDVMGLEQHDRIAVGQPRTADELAQRGLIGTVTNGTETIFNSFWGQFGWMKAPLQPREYAVLALFSTVAWLGLFRWFWQRGWRREGMAGRGLLLCGLWIALNAGLVFYYNLEFVQYQGRYLFPALTPIMLFMAIGLGAWLPRRWRPVPWAALALLLLALDLLAIWQRLPGMSGF